MIYFLVFALAFSSTGIDFASRSLLENEIFETKLWSQQSRADPEGKIKLVFALKQRNADILERKLIEVSDPLNPNYGKHLTREQVNKMLKPSLDTYRAVKSWLKNHGIKNFHIANNDYLTAIVTINKAEELLNCEYYSYIHSEVDDLTTTRTTSYSVPSNVASYLDFVAPTVHFMNVPKVKQVNANSPQVSPSRLRELYSVGKTVGSAPNNKQAVTGFLKQYFHQSDQNEFYSTLYKDGKGTELTVKGNAKQGFRSGIEAMLDTEYVTVTGTKITTEFWSYSGSAPDNPENEPFLDWLLDVANTTDSTVPKLFSTSYGEDEDSVSKVYASRINTEFQKLGARGITVLFASGDSGAAGSSGECKHNQYVPQWPAASPYVTSVGATTDDDKAAASFSSGGFSNRYGQTTWQSSAVDTYLQNSNVPDSKYFNSSGRGFPDISAAGTGFTVVANRIPAPGVSGTSCSSPTAAGVFALINDYLLQNGKPTLGFLNPFLYKAADALNDVSEGSNEGCGAYTDGFPAVKGWDAVTGLGTPNYIKLIAALEVFEQIRNQEQAKVHDARFTNFQSNIQKNMKNIIQKKENSKPVSRKNVKKDRLMD